MRSVSGSDEQMEEDSELEPQGPGADEDAATEAPVASPVREANEGASVSKSNPEAVQVRPHARGR